MLRTLFLKEFWTWPELDYSKPSKPEERFFRPFAWGLGIALAIGVTLALSTYGTNDILFFKSYAVKAARTGVSSLYRDGANLIEFYPDYAEPMAHPPGIIHLWAATLWIEWKTGVPFHVWFRLLTTLAHMFTACILYRLIGGRLATYFVLCPAGIMLASFHGNSDPLVVAFLIWAIYSAEQRIASWLVGLLFAAACSIKIWPLFLLPALWLSMATWRQRILFFAAAFGGWFAFGAPYTFRLPVLIAKKVLAYRSLEGWWGFSIVPGYNSFGVDIAFAAVLLATISLYRAHSRLYWMVGASIAVFLVFTPGFGVQYLDWILPFAFVLGWRAVLGIYIFSSALLFIAYTNWSGGLPWYFADSLRIAPPPYSLPVVCGAFICWIVLMIGVFSATPPIPWKRAVTG